MSEPEITIGKLYLLRGSLLRKGLSTGVEFVNQAIETLQSLDEENDSLRAEVERLTPKPMTWTSERPKVAGLYLSRQVGDIDFWLLVVSEDSLSNIDKLPRMGTREFAGPYPVPQEQEAARVRS